MRPIGIDLGTTNSVAACCRDDPRKPMVLANSAGENLTPSVVSVRRRRDGGEAEVLVGRQALNVAHLAPEDTILSIKRLMGRDFADPQVTEVAKKVNYRVVKAPGEDPRAWVHFHGQDRSPADVSALILGRIRDDASRALSEDVTHAVITVPAYFNEGQRTATREAGQQAGLVVKKIIDEPTAAAVAFGVQARDGARHRILVYDMGGGTFDISILQMVRDHEGRDQYQVLQTEGDNWLGGDDFDRRIADKVVQWIRDQYGDDPTEDRRFLLILKQKAEEAKKALSHVEETEIAIPAAYKTSKGIVVDVEITITRTELNSMIQEFVDRSMTMVRKALAEQHLSPDDISDVLLVGGATLTPLVYQTVEGAFGAGKVRRSVNPMECVALGAGILAATLRAVECPKCKKENDETEERCVVCSTSLTGGRAVGGTGVSEVSAMALGIAAVKKSERDVFVPIIPKGTPYPLQEPMKQRFQVTSGKKIVVPVYEGNAAVASRNAEQGIIEYELPEEIDADTPVYVAFNYDRNRQLTVTISVPGTTLFKEKTLTLRHDRPRTPPPPSIEEDDVDNWREELSHSVEFATRFVADYGVYMDPGQSMKLTQDLDRAGRLLVYSDEVNCRRVTRSLQAGVLNCGLATQLLFADRATDGAPPDEAARIKDAAKDVRESFEHGHRERAIDQARVLKVMVAKEFQRRNVMAIEATADYGGLLRLLGE